MIILDDLEYPYTNDGKTMLWENNFLDYKFSDVKKEIVNYPLIVIVRTFLMMKVV